MRAVGTLQEDPAYKDKIESEIVSMSSEKGKASDALYDWGDRMHGLVVLGPDGDVQAVLKGHSWGGRDDVSIALNKLKETIDPLLK